MHSLGVLTATILLLVREVFPFSLFPTVDLDRLANSLGISINYLVTPYVSACCFRLSDSADLSLAIQR